MNDNHVEESSIETLNNKKKKKRFNILDVHTYTIIAFIVLLSYVLCLVVPSGKYKRIYDAASDSQMVVPGSFHYVPKDYPNPFDMLAKATLTWLTFCSSYCLLMRLFIC